MKVRSINFEAFKSLYSMTAEFDELTVITGANGSGKSNLVDGLVFIGNTYRHGLEFAVSHAGGYENIAHRRTRRARKPIKIAVQMEIDGRSIDDLLTHIPPRGERKEIQGTPDIVIEHSFEMRASSRSVTADFSVENELMKFADRENRLLAQVSRTSDGPHVEILSEDETLGYAINTLTSSYQRDGWARRVNLAESQLLLAQNYYFDISLIMDQYLSSITVFQLSPHTSRQSGVASPRAQLELHGENLPGAAEHLRRNSAAAWDSVRNAMRSIIPTLDDVLITYTEDRRLAVQFRERGVGRPWNSTEVSDGTIQCFALLVAIFDPRSSLLVIEELENALHPWILRELLQLCQESSRQIVLTTHSPVLLNAVPPECINVMWMKEGRSSISKLLSLDPSTTQLVRDGELSAFEYFDSGIVKQAIPRGLGGVE